MRNPIYGLRTANLYPLIITELLRNSSSKGRACKAGAQDVRVVEPGGRADLAQEALGTECVGEFRVEELERDRAVVSEVPGEIDRGHSPAPELALKLVAVPEGLA